MIVKKKYPLTSQSITVLATMILHEISVTYVPKYVIGFCRVGAEVWSIG